MQSMIEFFIGVLFWLKVAGCVLYTVAIFYFGALFGARNPQRMIKSGRVLKQVAEDALVAVKGKLP
jgi:hypothetical protein